MSNPDTSGMMRFLTDQLQEAEDAGDRGTFCLKLSSRWTPNNLISVDHGTRALRMGWRQSIVEPDQSM